MLQRRTPCSTYETPACRCHVASVPRVFHPKILTFQVKTLTCLHFVVIRHGNGQPNICTNMDDYHFCHVYVTFQTLRPFYEFFSACVVPCVGGLEKEHTEQSSTSSLVKHRPECSFLLPSIRSLRGEKHMICVRKCVCVCVCQPLCYSVETDVSIRPFFSVVIKSLVGRHLLSPPKLS